MPARKQAALKPKVYKLKSVQGIGMGPLRVMPARLLAPSTRPSPMPRRSPPQWRLPGYDVLSQTERLRH